MVVQTRTWMTSSSALLRGVGLLHRSHAVAGQKGDVHEPFRGTRASAATGLDRLRTVLFERQSRTGARGMTCRRRRMATESVVDKSTGEKVIDREADNQRFL